MCQTMSVWVDIRSRRTLREIGDYFSPTHSHVELITTGLMSSHLAGVRNRSVATLVSLPARANYCTIV